MMAFNNSSLAKNVYDEPFDMGMTHAQSIFFWVTFFAIFIIGLFGNFLVVLAIVGKQYMRRKLMNQLLMNLAVADFMNILVCAADWVQILLTESREWIIFEFLCPVVRYLEVVFLYASVLIQVAVAIERFVAIKYPLHVAQICTKKSVFSMITACWLSSAFLAFPYTENAISSMPSKDNNISVCAMTEFVVSFKAAECLIFYFLPLLVITVLYSMMARVLMKKTKTLHASVRINGRDGTTMALERLRARKRVIKMLFACVTVYFICYSPIQILFIASVFELDLKLIQTFVFHISVTAVVYASSACNPIMYTIFSTRFRDRFAEILRPPRRESTAKRIPHLTKNTLEGMFQMAGGGPTSNGYDRQQEVEIARQSLNKNRRLFEMIPNNLKAKRLSLPPWMSPTHSQTQSARRKSRLSSMMVEKLQFIDDEDSSAFEIELTALTQNKHSSPAHVSIE